MAIKGIEIFQDGWFITASACLVFCVWAWAKAYERLSLGLLFLGALALRFWAIQLDPFLHDWDERWHALIAKNFLSDPLTPRQRDLPLLPYDYKYWWDNYIWLHKPPLFMWQMALGMKFFGVGIFGLRFASALMGALQCLMMYRIGKLTWSKETGFLTAFFFANSHYQMELSIGNMALDQNDVAILFYVTASFWSLCEYYTSRRAGWAILTGVFAGLAVLVKWLPGLLVFAGWSIGWGWESWQSKRILWKEALNIAVCLTIALLVFMPWNWYVLNRFPLEFQHEQFYNWLHLTHQLEGHGASWDLYFKRIGAFFFPASWLLLVPGLYLMAKRSKLPPFERICLASIFGVWLFYSFIPKTKLPSWVFMTAGIMFPAFALSVQWILENIHTCFPARKTALFAIFLLVGGFLFLRTAVFTDKHHEPSVSKGQSKIRTAKRHNTLIYQQIDKVWEEDGVVVFLPQFEHTEAMFWSDKQAYWTATDQQVDSLLEEGISVAVFQNAKPEAWFQQRPKVKKLEFDLIFPQQ